MVLGSLSAVVDLSEAGDFGGFWNPRDASEKPLFVTSCISFKQLPFRHCNDEFILRRPLSTETGLMPGRNSPG